MVGAGAVVVGGRAVEVFAGGVVVVFTGGGGAVVVAFAGACVVVVAAVRAGVGAWAVLAVDGAVRPPPRRLVVWPVVRLVLPVSPVVRPVPVDVRSRSAPAAPVPSASALAGLPTADLPSAKAPTFTAAGGSPAAAPAGAVRPVTVRPMLTRLPLKPAAGGSGATGRATRSPVRVGAVGGQDEERHGGHQRDGQDQQASAEHSGQPPDNRGRDPAGGRGIRTVCGIRRPVPPSRRGSVSAARRHERAPHRAGTVGGDPSQRIYPTHLRPDVRAHQGPGAVLGDDVAAFGGGKEAGVQRCSGSPVPGLPPVSVTCRALTSIGPRSGTASFGSRRAVTDGRRSRRRACGCRRRSRCPRERGRGCGAGISRRTCQRSRLSRPGFSRGSELTRRR